MRRRQLHRTGLIALMAVAAAMSLSLADRHGPWVDEIFSLAMATGHSLEHPPEAAEPGFGDFTQGEGPRPAAEFAAYAAHDGAGPSRVLRAVLRSDTSPPLYYLLLWGWTRVLGTSDLALRLFSVLFALACFPLLWTAGRLTGGRAAAVPACALFTFAPVSVDFFIEGRMYSLLWFLTLATAVLTLRAARKGFSPVTFALWCAAAAAGLLTHYFFAFVLAAFCLWLWIESGSRRGGARRRATLAAALLVAALAVLPWYLRLPESLGAWRATAGWLDGRPSVEQAAAAPVKLAWSLISRRGIWDRMRRSDLAGGWLLFALIVLAILAGPGRLVSRRRRLAWLWLIAACTGPLLFDLWRGTHTSLYPRYAIAGLPAAMLLAGFMLSRLQVLLRAGLAGMILVAWIPGLIEVRDRPGRSLEPFRRVGEELSARLDPSDLVIVHSIPSGVIGIARYLPAAAPVAAWVEGLGGRSVPDGIESLVAGRRRVVLVRIHDPGEEAPEEDWLRENARLVEETRRRTCRILTFETDGLPATPATEDARH